MNGSIAVQTDQVDQIVGIKFGRRAWAYIIDTVIYFAVGSAIEFILAMIIAFGFIIAGQGVPLDVQSDFWVSFFVEVTLIIIYYTLFEWLFGATLGKVILKMRVVQNNGEPCRLVAALVRMLLRYVDGLFFGIVAYTVMKSSNNRRIGDKKAKSVVVRVDDPLIQQPRSWVWFYVAGAVHFTIYVFVSVIMIIALWR
jgi:uncharacterized RDD family membrane protein YckC